MKEPKKTGRPPKLTDDERTLSTLSGLAKIQCTTKEAAAVLGVSEPTFFAFLKRYEKAQELWENGKEGGKASLKRNQFRMAETNAAMAIWLGKQYLGQRDQSNLQTTHEAGDSFKAIWVALTAREKGP